MKCGLSHTLVLKSSGEVYAWVYNEFGQIGNGNNLYEYKPIKVNSFNDEKPVMISRGAHHSMAFTESGSVFSWGCNSSGQLGTKFWNTINSNTPKSIGFKEFIIKKISCGPYHSLLLTNDGVIYAFGHSSSKQFEANWNESKNQVHWYRSAFQLEYFGFTADKGTPKYMAPEFVNSNTMISTKKISLKKNIPYDAF